MIYTYCKDSLVFKKIKSSVYAKTLSLFILMNLVSGYFMYTIGIKNSIMQMSNEEKVFLIQETDKFSSKKMVIMLNDLNIKFPWIAMAQSIVETGNWRSEIFLENNNLFGMKEAKSRITTAIGTNRKHAHYQTWRESIYDYGFYQSTYLSDIKTEDEYFQYLEASYAEDPSYLIKVKNAIQKYKLKQLFK